MLASRAESGSQAVLTDTIDDALFIAAGSDPYKLLEYSYRVVSDRMGKSMLTPGSFYPIKKHSGILHPEITLNILPEPKERFVHAIRSLLYPVRTASATVLGMRSIPV